MIHSRVRMETHKQLTTSVGRISSASPQLGAARRGQEAGIPPGRSPPTQPRLPPGPKGLPEGAQREPANGTPETQTQRNREELKIRYGRPSVSLVFQLLCRLQESSAVHKLFAGVSVRTFGIELSVVHSSISTSGTYNSDNGGPCQELVLFPPELKRILPRRK